MTDSNNTKSSDKKAKNKPSKKKWVRPELSKLDTTHTNGTTPVLPGDAGNLRS